MRLGVSGAWDTAGAADKMQHFRKNVVNSLSARADELT